MAGPPQDGSSRRIRYLLRAQRKLRYRGRNGRRCVEQEHLGNHDLEQRRRNSVGTDRRYVPGHGAAAAAGQFARNFESYRLFPLRFGPEQKREPIRTNMERGYPARIPRTRSDRRRVYGEEGYASVFWGKHEPGLSGPAVRTVFSGPDHGP